MPIYDTREFVKRMTESGMPALQAETLADEHLKLLEEHLATKGDLTLLRAEMAQLRTELLGEMKALGWRLEWRLTVRLGAMMAAMVAALVAVVKL